MINMGAIMVTSLIKPEMILADRFDFIRKVISEFSAGRHVFCDMETVFGFILSTSTNYINCSKLCESYLQI